MSFWNLKGRLPGDGSGGGRASFLPRVGAGFKVTPIVEVISTVGAGFKASPVLKVTPQVKAGFKVTPFAAVEAAKRFVGAGFRVTPIYRLPAAALVGVGFALTQARFQFVCSRGAPTAASAGSNAFTNPTNAQGFRNGTLASGAGNALGARAYRLNLSGYTFNNKEPLTIVAAELRFYISQTGTTLNNGGMTIGWSSASRAYAQSAAFAANVDHLTTAFVVPITGVPLTWTEMASIVASVLHTTSVLNTSTCNVDAVELVVTTDTLVEDI